MHRNSYSFHMFRSIFLLFSVIATLLFPSSTHANLKTEGKRHSDSDLVTLKNVDQSNNRSLNSSENVFMACNDTETCRALTGSPRSDSANNVAQLNSVLSLAVAARNSTVTVTSPRQAPSPSSFSQTAPSLSAPSPSLSAPSPSPSPSSTLRRSPPPIFLSPTPAPAPAPAPTFFFDGPYLPTPRLTGIHQSQKRKVLIGIGIAIAAITAVLMCIAICCFRYKSKFCLTTKSDLDIEAFLENHRALAQKRYKFSEVKKMTNSFKDKLGQGGFGAVYKGKLPTGDLVAVKLLNASKGNGEEFINEVASISRTSHVNIVTLLGFCLEGHKKALIYEFMANGSLEKYIYKRGPETIASMSWENLYQIAIGIAQGLEYLHKGCITRILHFDIKPHNILLDENYCPKISDFGLAKLCPRKESIISMSNARGTMGYVAPEMCNRHFGGVSHKSDVYSYGMMLLEMVGGRKNINAEASDTSEIYFPHLVYKRLEQDDDLRPDEVMTPEENEIAKRMTVVGLWCIQSLPNDRPTMSRVLDMLEGSGNSLEMPPKPLFSSPTRSD